jgi:hypothetical protein
MKKTFAPGMTLDDHVGCFGDFDVDDSICRRFCVLSIRCAIEQDQNARMELLEELVSFDQVVMKIQ